MINIKKEYSALSKNEVRHYYFCKRIFGDIKPIKVPSIKDIDKVQDKKEADYWAELETNPLTYEQIDKDLEDHNKRRNGTLFWPDKNEF